MYTRAECQTWFLCPLTQIYLFSALYGSRSCPLQAAFTWLPSSFQLGSPSGRCQWKLFPGKTEDLQSFLSALGSIPPSICLFSMTPVSARQSCQDPSVCQGTLYFWWYFLPHSTLLPPGLMLPAVANSGLTYHQFLSYLCNLNSLCKSGWWYLSFWWDFDWFNQVRVTKHPLKLGKIFKCILSLAGDKWVKLARWRKIYP